RGIRHILARVKHPQTNGKIERFFGTLEQKHGFFDSLNEFVMWYNQIKPHMSLDFEAAETPAEAFNRKLPPERILGYTSRRWNSV
ncbi:MAG TPA: IS481 family transposase, partial [Euryarchaeota archaeon]|nr:IS481 family transposase [Euryarchaeota archaeon]